MVSAWSWQDNSVWSYAESRQRSLQRREIQTFWYQQLCRVSKFLLRKSYSSPKAGGRLPRLSGFAKRTNISNPLHTKEFTTLSIGRVLQHLIREVVNFLYTETLNLSSCRVSGSLESVSTSSILVGIYDCALFTQLLDSSWQWAAVSLRADTPQWTTRLKVVLGLIQRKDKEGCVQIFHNHIPCLILSP